MNSENVLNKPQTTTIVTDSTQPSYELVALALTSPSEFQDVESGGSSTTSNNTVESPVEPSETKNTNISHDFMYYFMAYVAKFKGVEGKKSPPMERPHEILASGVLNFIGILLVSVTSFWYLSKQFTGEDNTAVVMLTGSYGASAVLLYDAYKSPLAQPRNVFGSYLICSFLGITTRIICGYIGLERWTTCAFAVGIAIIGMNVTKTVHPPGGACALIAVIGGPAVWNLGFGFMATSVGGAFIMIIVALIGNNLVPTRQYPVFWW